MGKESFREAQKYYEETYIEKPKKQETLKKQESAVSSEDLVGEEDEDDEEEHADTFGVDVVFKGGKVVGEAEDY